MNDCPFCKIRDRKLPRKLVYEDEYVMVFPSIQPVKPSHLLIVPKEHIPEFRFVENPELREKLFAVVQKMIYEAKLEDRGYKIVINGGGHQEVDHLHIHLMGPMKPEDGTSEF